MNLELTQALRPAFSPDFQHNCRVGFLMLYVVPRFARVYEDMAQHLAFLLSLCPSVSKTS
jgi:hypothetical protein